MTAPKRSDPAYASIEKIERAKRKLVDLTEAINTFTKGSDTFSLSQRQGEPTQVLAKLNKPIPVDFIHESTEIAGHLRAALDKIVVELVEANERGTSGVFFPFSGIDRDTGKPEPFPTGRHETIEKRLPTDHWHLIIAQKPYPGGNDTLWSINQIANADKHGRGLVAVEAKPKITQRVTAIRTGLVSGEIRNFHPLLTEDHPEGMITEVTGASNMQVQASVTPRIVFGQIAPVQGKEVLIVLNSALSECERVVKTIRDSCF